MADAWHAETWEAYRDAPRIGRRVRLTEAQKRTVWAVFERVRAGLSAKKLATRAGLFSAVAAKLAAAKAAPFDFVVVDEAQDLGVAELRFLAALGGGRPDALFFAGDSGQRIFQPPFSWKSLGVDVRGRSRTLRVNYRTSHQIRARADRLLDPTVSDADGNDQERADTVSVFNGPPPAVRVLEGEVAEVKAVGEWLAGLGKAGVRPQECAIIVRSAAQLGRAKGAASAAGLPFRVLDDAGEPGPGELAVGTMHAAKGLEFRAVAVMACDDEVVPLAGRIAGVGDAGDLEEAYATERHLLYVACTRARDHLLVTSAGPASEFLDDVSGRKGGTAGLRCD